ncbi:unnamed protein product [Urochloa decumbens]|uniref:Uncharacterized protein n=1 Tax=Urochloa decumbens TaxID=240449 RepID=A0ABC8WGV0_9POAL
MCLLLLRLVCGDAVDELHRVAVNAVLPRAVGRRLDVPQSVPDGAVALEAAAEGDLPDAVAAAHAALGLHVGELVPDGAARGVAEPVERHPGRLHVRRAQLQVLLELVDHGAPAGVDAEVLERQLEVRDVRLDLGVEQLLGDERGEEEELLADGQDERAQRRDVGLERAAGDGHEVLGQRHAGLALVVLLLVHAVEGLVVRALMGAHDVLEAVLGAAAVGAAVGEQHGGAADAEQAVGDQHRLAVPEVPVLGDVLRADHHGVGAAVHLQHVAREVDGDDARAAAHPPEVEAPDVPAELVLVHDHGRQGRRRVEEAAVDDEDADVLGLDAGGPEQVVERAEHDGLGLEAGVRHGGLRRERVHGLRDVGLLAEAGALQDLALELEGVLGEAAELGVAHELLEGDLEVVGRLVAGEVDEVDGPGAGKHIDGGAEDEDGGEDEHGDEVVLEVDPQLPQIVGVGAPGLEEDHRHEREQHQGEQVGDEVVVPQLHVLEVHALEEVRQPPVRRRRRRGRCRRLGGGASVHDSSPLRN